MIWVLIKPSLHYPVRRDGALVLPFEICTALPCGSIQVCIGHLPYTAVYHVHTWGSSKNPFFLDWRMGIQTCAANALSMAMHMPRISISMESSQNRGLWFYTVSGKFRWRVELLLTNFPALRNNFLWSMKWRSWVRTLDLEQKERASDFDALTNSATRARWQGWMI